MKKSLVMAMLIVAVSSMSVFASVVPNFGPYMTSKATIEALKGVKFPDGTIQTTAMGTTAATGTWRITNAVMAGYVTAESVKATSYKAGTKAGKSVTIKITTTQEGTQYITFESGILVP